MPYKYQHEVPSMGDPLRVAAEVFARDVETYLYDESRAGHGNRDFLSWALARYDATKASTGNLPNSVLYWDPKNARRTDEDRKIDEGQKPGVTYNPNAQAQFGIKYPADHEVVTPDDADGDRDVLGLNEAERDWQVPYGSVAVHDPNMARFTSGNAVPYNPPHLRDEQLDGKSKDAPADEPADNPEFTKQPDEPDVKDN